MEGEEGGKVKGDEGGESFQREPGLGERLGAGRERLGAGGGKLSADMPGVPMGSRGLGQGGSSPAGTRSNGGAVLPRFWYPAVGGAAHSCIWE